MASVINSFVIEGINASVVKIETSTLFGQPTVQIVGLGDAAVKEAKERLESAITHEKFDFPKMKIIINLAPSDIKKSGSHFDLGMAIGLLIQSNQIIVPNAESYGFIGELSLNGEIRACSGVLPMAIEAMRAGVKNLVVPAGNIKEASLVKGLNILTFDTLKNVVGFLNGTYPYSIPMIFNETTDEKECTPLDFKDIKGQDAIIDFVIAAVSGGHNLLLSGAPGCGKSMIAKRIPTIMPTMTEEEALEVTKIFSVAGLLKSRGALIEDRPFRAPHHNASLNSLVGGGNYAKPGEISLAHNGVLFLDEIAEFNKNTLESLRQPMEDKIVTISRVRHTNTYPANFMFIAAMNPCPCGYYGEKRCHCSDYEILKYRSKISGPILDRIDIQKCVQSVNFMELSSFKEGRSSNEIKTIVERGRKIQVERYKGLNNISCNAQMTPALIREHCKLDSESEKLLQLAYDKFKFSARSYHKFLKVARTFADIDESLTIRKEHIIKTLYCRDLEKEHANLNVV